MDYRSKLISLGMIALLWGCTSRSLPAADCNADSGPCAKGAVTFGITPRPVAAMRELTFTVNAPAADMVDLSMPGMDMGVNRVPLLKAAMDQYQGRGVIVRCPSGATLWRAAVYNGDSLIAEYYFDVRR